MFFLWFFLIVNILNLPKIVGYMQTMLIWFDKIIIINKTYFKVFYESQKVKFKFYKYRLSRFMNIRIPIWLSPSAM